MRAGRPLCTLLLLRARGRMTGQELADELEVSVRTVYRRGAGHVPAGPTRPPSSASYQSSLPDSTVRSRRWVEVHVPTRESKLFNTPAG
jgi:hypothetical protein